MRERRRGVGRRGRDKEEESLALKSNIVQRGEREQMAVENVALKAPEERARLTDLAVSHGRLDVLGWRAEARVAGRALFPAAHWGRAPSEVHGERDRGWPQLLFRHSQGRSDLLLTLCWQT